MAIDVDKLISDVRNDINAKPNQAKTSDGKPVIVKGNAKTTQGKKANTTPKDTDKPLGRASGQRAFTSTPKGDTKGESTLKAAGTGAAAAYVYLKGLLDEIDAQTKARDEADSARLKAGRDAAEQGVDINTADGGLKKAHEEQQKDFEARAAKYAGVGEDEFKRAQELYTKSAEYEATAKEGLGKVGQFAVDLGIAGTQFAGDMALNTILPGAGIAAMGARAAGQGAYSASLEGKDINEQLTSGLKSAAVEMLTEKLFGLGSKAAYGAGIVKNKNLVNAVVNRLAKTDKGRTALKLLVGANEEGLEEVLSDVLNPVADRLLKLDDGKGDWSDLGDDMDVEQMLTDYLLGASLGLAGSSANIVNGSFSAENKAQRDKEAYQRALVDSGLESADGTKSRELAEKADKILSKSEKRGRRYLTDKEVEALREANIEAIAAEEAAKPRKASDIVADVAAGKVGAQEPTQQATSAPTMEQVVAAMTGRPIDAATISNAETVQQASSEPQKPTTLEPKLWKTRDERGGWGKKYDNTVAMLYVNMPIVNQQFAEAYDAEAYAGNTDTPLINAVIAFGEDVRQGTITPAQALTMLSQTYNDGGVEAVRKMVNPRTGNIYSQYIDQAKQIRKPNISKAQSQFAVEQSPMQAEMMDDEDLRYSSVGAASSGFTGEMSPAEQWVAEAQAQGDSALHPISDEQQRNLAEQQHRAPQEIPLLDPNGRLTRKGVSSIANSSVTNQEMNDILREEAFEGAFSYDAKTDKGAVRRANKAIKGRYWQALNEFLLDASNGKVSKDNTVKGIVLYNNAVQNGDYATALDIAIALANDGTNSAQALQARKLLAKLSPSGKLYSVVKTTEKIAREQAAKVGTKKLDKEATKIETAANEAIAETADKFSQRSKRKANAKEEEPASGANQVGEPFWFEYEDEVGKVIGEKLVKQTNNNIPKPKKFMQTIIGNLTSFANQLTPKAIGKPNMSATERIADYMANKEFYDNAWASAQDYIRNEYADNEQVLYALDEFTESLPTMTTPVGTQTMIKALAESAMATYESNKTIAIQNALNINGAAQQIADNLIGEVERISGLTLDEETKYTILRAAEDYVSNVVADTNPTQLAQAQIRDVMSTIGETVSEVAKKTNTNKTAVAMAVTDMLTTRWGLSAEDATNIAEVVQTQYTEMVKQAMETKLKQLYGEKKSPQIRSMTELFVESVNLGAFNSEEYSAKAAEKFFGIDIAVDPDLAQDYVEALEDGDKQAIDEAYKALVEDIARQVPANFRDKFNSWRYFAMLANPVTHFRNIFGTAGFAPVREIKNVLAVGGEVIAEKVTGGKVERTKAILTPSASDKALIATALADYAEAKDAILSGGKLNDLKIEDSFASDINDNLTIFNSRIIEKPRKFVSDALDTEDSWFSKPAYAVALARYLKANGISAKQWAEGTISAEKMAKARGVAIKEAKKATYRDINAFSEMVSKWRVKPAEADASSAEKIIRGGATVLVEGLMPFKKTPANILARAVEYSPVGFAYSLTWGIHDVRTGKITAAEYIDGLASGLTGTGIVALGAFLASQGILSGGADDNDEIDKLQGVQNYALNVGDKSITLSWLAPEAMQLFVGVELWNNMLDDDNENTSIWGLMQSLLSLSEPMTEMSMLSGVQGMIDAVRYSDNVLLGVGVQLATSYISQFIPTFFGKIESTTEDARQTTFIDKNSEVPPDIQKFVGKILNKFFGEYQQMDYIDAWGRTQDSGSVAERVFNNFVNPAYVNDIRTETVETELRRLADNGYSEVMPKRTTSSTQIEGEYMTQEQFETYAKTKGQASLDAVTKLINSTAYKNMSDADKAAAIKNVYAYADGIAKLKVNRNAEVESWISKAKDSGNPSQYITDQIYLKSVDSDGNGSSNSADKVRGLINGGYSGDKLISKVREYMTTESGNCELADLLEKTQSANIDDNIAIDVYEFKEASNNDKNADGKVTKSVKDKVKEYIGSLSIPAEQKNALYYSFYKKW